MIEEYFQEFASLVALGIESIVVLVVAYGALEALLGAVRVVFTSGGKLTDSAREVWFRFATWIVLALEFALAADIIRSAIAPTWESIGKLGAIALIRTLLNYFLMRDIDEFNERQIQRAKEATHNAD